MELGNSGMATGGKAEQIGNGTDNGEVVSCMEQKEPIFLRWSNLFLFAWPLYS